jgi:hypothetical protein
MEIHCLLILEKLVCYTLEFRAYKIFYLFFFFLLIFFTEYCLIYCVYFSNLSLNLSFVLNSDRCSLRDQLSCFMSYGLKIKFD